MSTWKNLVSKRHSAYDLNKNLPITKEALEALLGDVLNTTPSAFNSQSARLVLLTGQAHDDFWALVYDELKKVAPPASLDKTKEKLDGFAAGYGTVLFYEDMAVVSTLQEQFPLYAGHFPNWSEHAAGMHMYSLWVALAEHNIGASLQHYDPVIDEAVKQRFDIPDGWRLRAEMVFGGKNSEPVGKDKLPRAGRLLVKNK